MLSVQNRGSGYGDSHTALSTFLKTWNYYKLKENILKNVNQYFPERCCQRHQRFLIFPKAKENPEQLGSKTKRQQATHRTKPVETSCTQPSLETTSKLCGRLPGTHAVSNPSGLHPEEGQVHRRAATRPGWYSACDQPGAHTEGTLWGVYSSEAEQDRTEETKRSSWESRGAEPRITDSTSVTTWKLWKRSSAKPANLQTASSWGLRPHSSHESEPQKGWTPDKLP